MESLDSLLNRVKLLQEKSQQRQQQPKQQPQQLGLPLWPDNKFASPNSFLRSALFGVVRPGRRKYLDGEVLAAVEGIEIRYTGQRLDQADLDVWLAVVQVLQNQKKGLGERCYTTSYELLSLIGRSDTGGKKGSRALLQKRIERLVASAVTVRQGRYTYIGSLIRRAARDDETQRWVIELDPGIAKLFAPDQYTQIEASIRKHLEGKHLAQWLHAFYASHDRPYPMKIDSLLRLAGSENHHPRSARQKMAQALEAVRIAHEASGLSWSYEIRKDLVIVEKSRRRRRRKRIPQQ